MKFSERETMDLTEDIIMEVLLRLPVKSVMKFKCVSKGWNHMISDAPFRRSYLSRHGESESPAGFFYHRRRDEFMKSGPCMSGVGPAKFINTSTTNVEREELKSLDYLHELGYVIASSKGLLLLSRNPMSYHVYDLVSKKYFKLPTTLKKYHYVAVGFICQAAQHEQPTSSHLSFKVVRIGSHLNEHVVRNKTRKVDTYSSETGKWQRSTMTAASEFGLGPHFIAQVIGGVFHWWEFGGWRVVAYNPNNPEERVKLIELPLNQSIDLYGSKGFGGAQDDRCLQFYNIYKSIDVWILKSKQEGGSYLDRDEDVVEQSCWILTHRISFLKLGVSPSRFPTPAGDCFPKAIAICPWNPSIIFMHTPNQIVSYDQTDQKFEVVSSYSIDLYLDTCVPFQWPVWPCL